MALKHGQAGVREAIAAVNRPKGRPHKFNAAPTIVDGIRFASKKESRRYAELKLLQRAGEIRHLTLQPSFPLMAPVALGCVWKTADPIASTRVVGHYRADFGYDERRGVCWFPIVEDCKGMRTAMYQWKKRHFEIQYAVALRES